MKRKIMCMLGVILILSLVACTPTPEKNRTGEVKQTQGSGVNTEKNPDPTAPILDVVSIYSVSEDGSKLEGTMDAVEAKEYGTLNLSQFPDTSNKLLLQAVANTFLENLQVSYMTIQVNGEVVAENLTMVDAGK